MADPKYFSGFTGCDRKSQQESVMIISVAKFGASPGPVRPGRPVKNLGQNGEENVRRLDRCARVSDDELRCQTR